MSEHCRNCEAELSGLYCHECGQRDTDLSVSFWRLVGEAAKETFEVDGRIPRTARVLFTRPGLLVTEYLAGRRVRYSSPIRLYLLSALLCFLVVQLLGGRLEFNLALDEEREPVDVWAPLDPIIERNLDELARLEPDSRNARISKAIWESAPTTLTVMLPLFALLLKLLFWRRRYIEHLLCAINLHSVALLLIAMVVPFGSAPLALVAVGVIQLHVVFALRRVYEQSWPRTLAKYLVLSVLYLVLSSITLGVTVLVALLTL